MGDNKLRSRCVCRESRGTVTRSFYGKGIVDSGEGIFKKDEVAN